MSYLEIPQPSHDEIVKSLFRQSEQINKLWVALEPFARNANAVSLSDALGHITREDLLRARDALMQAGGGNGPQQ